MATKFAIETVFSAVDKISAPVDKITARVDKMGRSLTRSLRKADKALGAVNSGMLKVAKVGAAGVVAAATATTVALNKTTDAADSLAKESRRLDFDIEALQKARFVAEQSGVSVELLSKSLGAFSKRLGEAAGGTGPLVSGLKNINPELLEQLKSADSVSDAYDLYINAMRDAGSATEKAALANAAFSRSGLALANISDNSAGRIAAMNKEMEENGLISREAAEAAEAYNDASNRLKRSITGTIQTGLLPLTKILTPVLDKMRAWVVTNRQLITTRLEKFFTQSAKALGDFFTEAKGGGKLMNTFSAIGEVVRQVAKGVAFLAENGKDLAIVLGSIVAAQVALKTAIVATRVAMVAWSASAAIVKGSTIAWSAASVALSATLGAVRVAVLAFNLALAANPIGLIVKLIGSLVAAGTLLWQNWGSIAGLFAGMWDSIGETFRAGIDSVMALTSPFMAVADSIGSIWGKLVGTPDADLSANVNITPTWGELVGTPGADLSANVGAAPTWGKLVGTPDEDLSANVNITPIWGKSVGTPDADLSANVNITPIWGKSVGTPDEDLSANVGAARTASDGVISPQESIVRSINENKSSAEVTLRNETDAKAEVSQQRGPMNLQIANSGAF
jgi:hypothetical protein